MKPGEVHGLPPLPPPPPPPPKQKRKKQGYNRSMEKQGSIPTISISLLADSKVLVESEWCRTIAKDFPVTQPKTCLLFSEQCSSLRNNSKDFYLMYKREGSVELKTTHSWQLFTDGTDFLSLSSFLYVKMFVCVCVCVCMCVCVCVGKGGRQRERVHHAFHVSVSCSYFCLLQS